MKNDLSDDNIDDGVGLSPVVRNQIRSSYQQEFSVKQSFQEESKHKIDEF